jgi:four helix bundle protein
MRRLESLDAWKAARQLAAMAYRLTLEAPLSRHFALSDQIRRAAPSVAANVAEGYGLATKPQFVRCLRIALGSAMELRTHLELVQELRLSTEPEPVAEALQRCERLIGLIIGLIRSLVARP